MSSRKAHVSGVMCVQNHFGAVIIVTFSFHADTQTGAMLRSGTVGNVGTLKCAKVNDEFCCRGAECVETVNSNWSSVIYMCYLLHVDWDIYRVNINTSFCKYSIAIVWIGCLGVPVSEHQDKNCCWDHTDHTDCSFPSSIKSYAYTAKTPWYFKRHFMANVIQIFNKTKGN